MALAPASQVIPRLGDLADRTVLVVGDVVLDRYIVGQATRLSREAPVPVLLHERTFCLPGSAANPARNIRSLGSRAIQAALIGDDAAGEDLLALLREADVDTSAVVRLSGRATNIKQRILARGSLRYPQQIVRVDWVEQSPLQAEQLAALARQVEAHAHLADAILLSDYQGGAVSGPVLEVCRAERARRGIPICVDAQSDLWQYEGATCVKCNRAEAEQALGRRLRDEADFERATDEMLRRLNARLVAITRGEQGISLRDADEGYQHLPAANVSEVYDVVGAGDTVIALLTLGAVASWPAHLAATVAQLGAGIVIQRLGNATTCISELEAAAREWLPAAV